MFLARTIEKLADIRIYRHQISVDESVENSPCLAGIDRNLHVKPYSGSS